MGDVLHMTQLLERLRLMQVCQPTCRVSAWLVLQLLPWPLFLPEHVAQQLLQLPALPAAHHGQHSSDPQMAWLGTQHPTIQQQHDSVHKLALQQTLAALRLMNVVDNTEPNLEQLSLQQALHTWGLPQYELSAMHNQHAYH